MQGEDNIFQCPYCGHEFNGKNRKPMILCMSQHTACQLCVQGLFKNVVNKQLDMIDCPFRCGRIRFGDVQKFRYLNQIIETKERLNRAGSTLKRQMNSFNTDKRILMEELHKERAKNEWLIQINERKEKSQNEVIRKFAVQIKNQMGQQRGLLIKSFQNALEEMEKRNKKSLENELRDHQSKTIKKVEEIIGTKNKALAGIQTKMQTIQKQLNQQTLQFTAIKNQLKNIQTLKIMIVKMNNSEEQKLRLNKSDKQQIKAYLISLESLLIGKQKSKQQKIEKPKVPQKENEKNKDLGRIKSQKQLQIPKNNLDANYKAIYNEPFKMPSTSKNIIQPSAFTKKNSLPNALQIQRIKMEKEQPKNSDKQLGKIQLNRPRFYTDYTQFPLKMKTQPNQKPYFQRQKPNQDNQMRTTWGPEMFKNIYRLENEAKSSRHVSTQKNNNSFKRENKNSKNYQSQKQLNKQNESSLIEYQKAQQNKTNSIIQQLKSKYGLAKVRANNVKIRRFIDQQILLPQDELIRKISASIIS